MQTKQNKKTYGTLLVAIILIRRSKWVSEEAQSGKQCNQKNQSFFFFRQKNGKSNEDKRERENKQKIY